MGPGSRYGYFRATRTRIDADTTHIAPRETYSKIVPDILGLGVNRCRPRLCLRVSRVATMSQEWVKKIDELTTGVLVFSDIS